MKNAAKYFDDFLNKAKEFNLKHIQIFLANPYDLAKLDMSKMPSNFYFVSHHYTKRGKIFLIKDEKMKKEWYDFLENNPCRVLRGGKIH